MRRLGVVLKVIDDPDSSGRYLMNRIRHVRDQLAARPGLVWTIQYENNENPRAHFLSTTSELLRQVTGFATIFIPASTGGTLVGGFPHFPFLESSLGPN
jgi:N-(2-amino-2-carboxyethyl)-L-glutamate synthase